MSYTGLIHRGPIAADVIGRYYTTVFNAAVRDRRLSRRARGLLVELLSHRDGFGISISSLMASGPEGRDAIRGALAELEKYGYLHRTRNRDEQGRLGETVYRITDMPEGLQIAEGAPWSTPEGTGTQTPRSEPESENPTLEEGEEKPRSEPKSGFPTLAEPTLANPQHKKNNSSRSTTLSGAAGSAAEPDASVEAGTGERESRAARQDGPADAVPHQRAALSRAGSAAVGQLDPDAEAFVSRLPGGVGRKSVPMLARLVSDAVAEGWSYEDLDRYLRSRVDVARVYAPARLYREHLEDRPAPPAARPARQARNAASSSVVAECTECDEYGWVEVDERASRCKHPQVVPA